MFAADPDLRRPPGTVAAAYGNNANMSIRAVNGYPDQHF